MEVGVEKWHSFILIQISIRIQKRTIAGSLLHLKVTNHAGTQVCTWTHKHMHTHSSLPSSFPLSPLPFLPLPLSLSLQIFPN